MGQHELVFHLFLGTQQSSKSLKREKLVLHCNIIFFKIEAALLSHWWYQEKFEDYPKSRKVLVPFIF